MYGSSVYFLAPSYCTACSYRARQLRDCPKAPLLIVAAPLFNRILPLLSQALADHQSLRCQTLLILPYWPAQPWWPLVERLAKGKIVKIPGKPWVSPAGRKAPYSAIAIWIGKWLLGQCFCYLQYCLALYTLLNNNVCFGFNNLFLLLQWVILMINCFKLTVW